MKLETDLIINLISRIRRKANSFIVAELEKYGMKAIAGIVGRKNQRSPNSWINLLSWDMLKKR